MTDVETDDTSLTVRRTFDAPRERVFEAWTDPERIDQWWGPDGFTTETDEMDVRPGGVWRFVMTGPDGDEYRNRIVYDAVERPTHLAYTHEPDDPDDAERFEVTVDFAARDDTTTVTMEMRFASAAALDDAVEFGAVEGATQTLAGLADYLTRAPPSDRA